jgi:hypothetical protein
MESLGMREVGMGTRVRATHVVCIVAGGGIGVALGGLFGVEVDLSAVEARGLLVTVLALSAGTLLLRYFERRIKAYVDRVDTLRKVDRQEGYVEGYAAAVIERLP